MVATIELPRRMGDERVHQPGPHRQAAAERRSVGSWLDDASAPGRRPPKTILRPRPVGSQAWRPNRSIMGQPLSARTQPRVVIIAAFRAQCETDPFRCVVNPGASDRIDPPGANEIPPDVGTR